MAEIANRCHATVVQQPQFNKVSRPGSTRITEHCEDLAAVEPAWDQVPVGHAIVVREVGTHLATTSRLPPRHEVKLQVIDKHGANAIPVAGIKERGIAP